MKYTTVLGISGMLVEVSVDAVDEKRAEKAIKKAASMWIILPLVLEKIEEKKDINGDE